MYQIREDNLGGSNFKLTALKHDYIDSGVIGSIVGKLEFTLFVFDRHTAVIADLEVPKEYRRQGIATELLKTAVERIFSRPWMHNIMLQDGSENQVTGKIAKRLGFQKDGRGWNVWRLKKNVG